MRGYWCCLMRHIRWRPPRHSFGKGEVESSILSCSTSYFSRLVRKDWPCDLRMSFTGLSHISDHGATPRRQWGTMCARRSLSATLSSIRPWGRAQTRAEARARPAYKNFASVKIDRKSCVKRRHSGPERFSQGGSAVKPVLADPRPIWAGPTRSGATVFSESWRRSRRGLGESR
jgi:hypothetical protein